MKYAWLAVLCLSPLLAQTGLVTGAGNFGRIVADRDKSIEFYRDVLGLELTGTPRPFDPNLAIMKMGNTIGAQSRIAVLKAPDSNVGVELIEYKDIDRKPVHPRSQDPGVGNLILLVRDIDGMLSKLKKAGAPVVTAGGAPLDIGGKTRGVFVKDPDGFFIGLVQRDPLPETTAPASSNVIGAICGVTVAETEQAKRIYRDALGFQVQMEYPYSGDKARMDLGATRGGQYRSTVTQIPGSNVSVEFLEFKDIDRKPLKTRLQDPGTTVLQLRVKDVSEAVKTLKAAGSDVVSVGGEPVEIAPGLRIAIVRDPSNLFLELIQR